MQKEEDRILGVMLADTTRTCFRSIFYVYLYTRRPSCLLRQTNLGTLLDYCQMKVG